MDRQHILLTALVIVFITGCSTRGTRAYTSANAPSSYSSDKGAHNSYINKKDYSHPTMRPYVIRGIKYYPTVVNVGDEFDGFASWYGPDFHGKLTSNGETYNMYDMTAAHKTLPMNTIVKVTNLRNRKSVVVRINDRGPFIERRIIDLSNTAAKKIDMLGAGTAPVKVEVLGFHSKDKRYTPLEKDLQSSPQDQVIDGFALQIASFSRIEGAIETQQKYNKTDGYETIIKDMQTQSGRMFKVWLKGFRSEQEARDYLALGNFKGSFIVRED
ncbi:MAG TPA: septal ring lytic transglycosylase RlpA family protein [Sulfurimonas sp.]|uniref:septal ring lytic transglycosylase RlpA family protein n=1 Tax=Sulfurimonas sp. TaxID=2022749 RepID=UPI002CD74C5C|nr:septal ring lytic transglycosylase RlpA family protein [Sulfurimonas sp.]HUH41659.1 septal ring lytic transglycosylase RlpA family protein [Sulfurimonas sp.]